MKDWKVVAMASFVVNVVMVVLLIIAFVYMKSTVTAKNEEIDTLQQQETAKEEKAASKKEEAVAENASSSSETEALHSELQQLKSAMNDLPSEQKLLAKDEQTEALMHYEDAYMQAKASLNNVYETLNRELSGQEKAHLQLDQQKWLQDLKSMQAKQLSMNDDTAKLDAAKETYTRTIARSEELLQQYPMN
ncbi:hypothetical protein [Solibacillus sp.]|uniref:hypothetical protein n=1 Tax=Solibacillus sp. TaxID=1909654 RepID=UPI003314D194